MSQRPRRRSLIRGRVVDETAAESAAPNSPPEIRRREQRTKQKNVGSKRQSSSQTTTFSYLSRENVEYKLRSTDTNTPTIGELKSSVVLVQQKDVEEWHQGVFLTTLSTKKICFLKTSKYIWLGFQCDVVMSKLREKNVQKLEESGLDMQILESDVCMTHAIPWEKVWLSFEYQVLQQEMRAMKFSTSTSLGHKSKASANKEKDWSMGTEFNDRYLKVQSQFSCSF